MTPPWIEPLARRLVLWNRRRLQRRLQARMPQYGDWCTRFDALDEATRAALQQRLAALLAQGDAPTIGLLLEPMKSAIADHAALLQSLQVQLYPHWQLSVAVREGDVDSAAFWKSQAATDSRLQIVPVATRAARLNSTQQPWLAFTDTSERWREHALLLLAEAAVHHPGCVLVYGDEDRLDDAGQRSEPRFKCDWNPDLLLSHDCIGRPALGRTASLQAAAPLDDEAPGPWRHALALRGTGGRTAEHIVHVPHVLLHRTASAAAQEETASVAAVQAHLARTGERGTAEPQPGFDGVRVRFALQEPPPPVTLLIPTRNGLALLRQCIDSILQRSTYPNYDIVVIDNGSDDPACLAYLQQLQRDSRICVRRDDSPFNFAALNNAAAAKARGEYLALVNNDIEVITPGWLEEMVTLAARPGVGAVGARLWYSDGTLQHGGVITGIGGGAGHAHKRLTRGEPGLMGRAQRLQTLSAVTAACLVLRRSAYEQVQGMDAEHFAVACNDIDLCLRLRAAGLRNVWTPFAELYHHESVSRGRDHAPEKKQRFLRELGAMQTRWGASLDHDPAYNPNLTLANENFALADPPRVNLRQPWFAEKPKQPRPG
ncbi:MAG: glycosyltransferase family 2 protein [Rubrivivax sp.]|nr:glycosyltransferase family 2 protein [Rubrivivax sp.]